MNQAQATSVINGHLNQLQLAIQGRLDSVIAEYGNLDPTLALAMNCVLRGYLSTINTLKVQLEDKPTLVVIMSSEMLTQALMQAVPKEFTQLDAALAEIVAGRVLKRMKAGA